MRELLGLDDVIFDLAITPEPARRDVHRRRRPRARRALLARLRRARAAARSPTPSVANDITVVIEAPDRCPRYLGRVARVTMGASPAWMAQRLVKAGMRPISNVVDVTNYVLLERNQPLHAFDLVAAARAAASSCGSPTTASTMTTLDGVERELTAEDLLICDAERAPQAIAGIMGGSTSEVSDATTEILLESAYFERMGIARSRRSG